MRICLYTETALPKLGGQELVVDALARQFIALGHEALVLAPRPRGVPVRSVTNNDAGLPYPVVRHPRFISTRRLVSWYRHWLLRLHRSQGFDVLHCHSVYPCGYLAALARERLRVPVVITSHGGDVREGNCRLAKPGLPERHSMAIRAADALVAISRFTRDGYRRLCPETRGIVDIPNGVHLEPFAADVARPAGLAPAIQAAEYVLFLGRLHARKGVDVLLDAFALLPSQTGAKLVIAGDGDERPALAAQAARLRLADRVCFVGSATGETKVWLLKHARCVAIPSRTWEAFPLVVLESYAAGRPVIGTAIPGLADLIQPEQTGLLVPPESPGALAEGLERFMDGADFARRCGETARQAAQQYSWRSVSERYLTLFERLRAERREGKAA